MSRPSLRADTKRQAKRLLKNAFGNFIDENVISDWHYGHRTGVENRRILKAADEKLGHGDLKNIKRHMRQFLKGGNK